MREGRCRSLIEHMKLGRELKSTLSIGKLFQISYFIDYHNIYHIITPLTDKM